MSLLITGAAGNLGSQIVSFLAQWNDPSAIIATSRSSANEAKFVSQGLQFRIADFAEPSTLPTAFAGADKLLIISTLDYDTSTRIQNQKNAIDAAVAMGVEHIYYTSGAFGGYGNESKAHIQQADYQTEDYLKAQGVRYTIIREGPYAHQFMEYLNYHPGATEIVIPCDGPVAWADRADLAEATARIIHSPSDKYANQTLLLTGPRAVTLSEVGGMVGKIVGKELPIVIILMEAWIEGAIQAGLDEWTVKTFFASMYRAIEMGDLGAVTTTMEELLGRKPKDIEEIVRETLASGS